MALSVETQGTKLLRTAGDFWGRPRPAATRACAARGGKDRITCTDRGTLRSSAGADAERFPTALRRSSNAVFGHSAPAGGQRSPAKGEAAAMPLAAAVRRGPRRRSTATGSTGPHGVPASWASPQRQHPGNLRRETAQEVSLPLTYPKSQLNASNCSRPAAIHALLCTAQPRCVLLQQG